jgi:hypothetical protein
VRAGEKGKFKNQRSKSKEISKFNPQGGPLRKG